MKEQGGLSDEDVQRKNSCFLFNIPIILIHFNLLCRHGRERG